MYLCFLCKVDLSQGALKKKKKRLCGETCRVARSVLAQELGEQLMDLSGSNSFLCHSCDHKLQKIADMENALREARIEIRHHVSTFQLASTSTRKRSIPIPAAEMPMSKDPRVDDQLHVTVQQEHPSQLQSASAFSTTAVAPTLSSSIAGPSAALTSSTTTAIAPAAVSTTPPRSFSIASRVHSCRTIESQPCPSHQQVDVHMESLPEEQEHEDTSVGEVQQVLEPQNQESPSVSVSQNINYFNH